MSNAKSRPAGKPTVEVVIPVYNEERDLPRCIERLHGFLHDRLPNPWRILVADNGSTDRTLQVAEELSKKYSLVGYYHLDQKGRGRALKTVWLDSEADILTYMDVDLSTSLEYFPKLIEAIENGADIAIGSRLKRGARTSRSFKRELTSRGYNVLIKSMFWGTPFQDAQCGFKAITRPAAQAILPHVVNFNWFFDTEMLLIAARNRYRIYELPVEWAEDPGTTVKVFKTAMEDVKGLLRLRFGGMPKLERAKRP